LADTERKVVLTSKRYWECIIERDKGDRLWKESRTLFQRKTMLSHTYQRYSERAQVLLDRLMWGSAWHAFMAQSTRSSLRA
jgi:hypothetical protein